MGSILPVGDGNARPIVPPNVQGSDQTRSSGGSEVDNQNASSVTSATSSSSSITVSQVQSSAAQFMESFGGASANSQAMQLLIALMILLALLESMQKDGDGDSALSQLGSDSSNRSQFTGIFSSSSTVSYEQIVTSSMSQGGESAGPVDETQDTSGDQLDVSA